MWLEFYQSTMLVWHLPSGLSANSHKITQRSNYAVMERGITQTRWQCLNRRTPSVASCFHWICLGLLLMLVISSMESVECALRNVNLVIEPPAVRRGQHVVLRCMYDLEGAPLYSAKFYRGQLEFYRYTPGEFPNTKVFPFPGIHVDVTSSNATQVLIRNVGFGLSGNFSCEVTADAPLFSTATASGTMQVVELPDKRPQLYTEHSRYEPGDILRANCSTPPSRPRAELKFTINNMVITSSESQFIRTIDNLIASRISLKLQLQGVHFSSVNPAIYNNGYSLNSVYNHGGPRYAPNPGGLVLRCTAQIGDLYQEYKEIELGTPQKDPVPARVTLSSGSSMKNFFSTYFSTSAAVTQRAGSVHLAQITIALVVLLLSRYTLLTQRDSPLAPSFIPRNGQLATAQCKSSENSPFALRLQDTTPMTDLFSKEIINSRHRSEQKFRSCDCDSNTFSC